MRSRRKCSGKNRTTVSLMDLGGARITLAINLELSYGRHGAAARVELLERAGRHLARIGLSGRHEPVLLAETLAFLRNGPGLYLDATLGDGGHAEALLDSESGARLLGSDRDPAAVAGARARLARFGDRVSIAHATFRELPALAVAEPLAGALLDLGLSSRQIDDPARGMSFMGGGPLALRGGSTPGATTS